jgi:phosphoribosyl-AMP cyclohydrolase
LIPAIIQDKISKEILMLGYMNKEALNLTLENKWVYFWSRSRNKLWLKGEESGNKLRVVNIISDCDNDSLLIKVKLVGLNACHTGSKSCFFNRVI